jgi:demethylmenaquinone methyltransferase/2-methoxy-6-polyprenyl-1,4-benzoquinol methylase
MDYQNYNIVEGFNSIAPRYDLVNDAMSLGLHRLWRRSFNRQAAQSTPRGGSLLDVATGTGEVILGLLPLRPDLKITGVDPSSGMLDIAREKLERLPRPQAQHVELMNGDARNLDFPDNTFDTVTTAWGIRNVQPFVSGLREFRRVLKPGGTLLILESGLPENRFIRFGHELYSKLLPIIGGGLSGFKPAYEYYRHTAENFTSGRDFVAAMQNEDYTATSYHRFFGGIVYLYTARK